MTTTEELRLVCDEQTERYRITRADGSVALLGYDECLGRVRELAIELAGRGAIEEKYIDEDVPLERGSRTAYNALLVFEQRLRDVCPAWDPPTYTKWSDA